ncbi:hypothetical protein DH2020_018449 [Rehmannia glutinosa]|uniref:Pectinesterase n=1 Tax=Rehmannia glutinosa TaxID=99300 RepID=A0ABR0WMI3_REHGL
MSISSLQPENINNFSEYFVSDVRTWLSTVITDQQTCLDGLTEFENISLSIQEEINTSMQNATIFTSNSLAIISNGFAIIRGFQIPVNRKLVEAEEVNLRPNLTVAKDGSGDYRTINEAVQAMPKRSKERFFIYVKKGEYKEQVVVHSDCWNLMIYGDGMKKTVVSGSLNYADGVATYDSGTFIAEGRGFIAKDMGFKNTAGPAKLQAVALRSSSDESIFYRCHIDAYQDTLYAHTNRQFYRECDNSIRNLTAKTFLGRPWNNYSTTVVMETYIQGIVDPMGWTPWEPDSEAPDTIFYAEYMNTGPGSVLNQRVMWPGYRPNITEEEAEKFYVEPFIQEANG